MDKHYAKGNKTSINTVVGHVEAQALVQVFKQCGDDLRRELLKQQIFVAALEATPRHA
jgi:branched-chain amino acid transport system substrate-binding protein